MFILLKKKNSNPTGALFDLTYWESISNPANGSTHKIELDTAFLQHIYIRTSIKLDNIWFCFNKAQTMTLSKSTNWDGNLNIPNLS